MSLRSVLILVTVLTSSGSAQEHLFNGPFDPGIPRPRAVLGYDLGERFTDYRLLERYTLAVAEASERVVAVEYGRTYEDRPLRVFIVSSPRNLARLKDIQSANVRLTDPRSITSAEADAIARDLPGIVWFSFGIHGNESSSPEAALAVLYQLAAGQDARTEMFLDRLVLILDPSLNPDGRERYVRWINGVAQNPPNEAPNAYEHFEQWPGGRTNHYYFDLNRDWSWLTQRESQARVALYRTWMPHTHVDFHEMGYESSYFFFPAAPPFHVSLPASVKEWGIIYGRGNARALDSIGSAYYVGEDFDMFYPGYGDSWPTFNGGIGMTYEQAGSGRAGLAIRRRDGTTLTLRDRIRNHFTTAMATLATTVEHRQKRIGDFRSFWSSAVAEGARKGVIIIPADQDPSVLSECASLLLAQGIEVHQLQKKETMSATRFYESREKSRQYGPGTLIIPMGQPQGRLAAALLEPHAVARDTFFYDVSAWTLPIAYGLDAYSYNGPLPASARMMTDAPSVTGGVSGDSVAYAYLIPWNRTASRKLSIALLKEDAALRVSHRTFSTHGRAFGAGTIVLFASTNPGLTRHRLDSLARSHGAEVVAVRSGWTDAGISLGSDYIRPIALPKIAVATGDGVSPYDYGELWFMLERELSLPFTPVQAQHLGRLDLGPFDILVLPGGYSWKEHLDSAAVARLKQWVQDGGIVLALEEAGRTLRKSAGGLTPARLAGEKDSEAGSSRTSDSDSVKKELFKTFTAFEKEEYTRLNRIPGSIFRVVVDTTHPIGFGTPGLLYVLKTNGTPYALPSGGHTVARFTSDTLQVSGYLPRGKGTGIAGSPYIQSFGIGKGTVVLFSEPMTFRMFWRATAELVTNALLLLYEPSAD